jgi:hypothetical protein
LRQNVSANYSYWIGRTLNSNLEHSVLATGTVPGTQEPYLRRMQFDLIYSFYITSSVRRIRTGGRTPCPPVRIDF